MIHYFCISVTFLDPLFHGKVDSRELEWPPSPWRLFQSLLAGSLTGCRKNGWPDARAEAFCWLEQRDAPLIIAPEARPITTYTFYVPNNDSDRVFDRQERLTSKVARPHCLINGQTLYYLWRIDEGEWPSVRPHAELLSHESRHMLAFGWGIDLVVGNGKVLKADEAAKLEGQRWKPWDNVWLQTGMRRVPTRGSLSNLEQCYESFLESVQGRRYQPRVEPRVFRRVPYMLASSMAPRPYISFELRQTDDRWATFRHVDVIEVAAMLRHAACEAAKGDSQEFPGGSERYVAGHASDRNDPSPRFSYLPLPTVGHRRADGLIRRMLIAEPYGSDGTQVRWAAQRLRNRTLVNDNGKEQALLLHAELEDRVMSSYLLQARTWSSVTPVILPGFDDSKYGKAERLLTKAVQQAGLPAEAIKDVILRKAPFWPGSQHPRFYHRPVYLRDLSAWHVSIRLSKPIPGPLAIGAGRHCGLGLFVRDEDD